MGALEQARFCGACAGVHSGASRLEVVMEVSQLICFWWCLETGARGGWQPGHSAGERERDEDPAEQRQHHRGDEQDGPLEDGQQHERQRSAIRQGQVQGQKVRPKSKTPSVVLQVHAVEVTHSNLVSPTRNF